ncbi:glucocorticoid modulatory element-binding protein 1-like isoform X3 [Hypomesus transpacificus]|uniref:glucocorticoid modulatory element-binding protein 1-like isoform X3 n=1 Tax=Hypomesus transpacificus TaxID=137520 RepID=UPI001F078B40|nr:glucocorticoid modulatory element-binding protein 1-like isoform X3 [Hypomesus transpacificus]
MLWKLSTSEGCVILSSKTGAVMAGTEVTVTPGGVVRVKEEEEEEGVASDSHRRRVILHLQPILQGAKEDNAETRTTVLAIETHHEESGTDGEEVEYGYPITCGDSRGVLLFKKFVCPGINVRCVKFNDQLISPKQFVHLAGKATLKDWKRAIRLGGVMLRKMMDSGQIDFYQHEIVCTNTCRSTKFDLLVNNTRIPPGSALQIAPTPSPLPGDRQALEVEESLEEKPCTIVNWSSGRGPPNNTTKANGHFKRRRVEFPDETLGFWRGVSDIGLMGDVLSSIRTELLSTLRGVEVRSDEASLLEAGLEDRFEDQRRQGQDGLHPPHAGCSFRPASSKRPRLHRTSSSTTQTRIQTVLSPITTSPTGQIVSVAGLPVATLAQLPTGSQHFTHHAISLASQQGREGTFHAGLKGTLFSPATESGVGVLSQPESQEKEQHRGTNKDRSWIKAESIRGTVVARKKDSHLRREEQRGAEDSVAEDSGAEDRGAEDRGAEDKMLREKSCDVEVVLVEEEPTKERDVK